VKPHPVITSWPERGSRFAVIQSKLPISTDVSSVITRVFGDSFTGVFSVGNHTKRTLEKMIGKRQRLP
jgi:hypothetical protein